jgi:hypothetical protein
MFQVPPYLRRSVKAISSIPASSASAYTSASRITFFGKVNADIFVHESSHAQVLIPTEIFCNEECSSLAK